MLEPSIYSISGRLKAAIEAIDTGCGLHKGRTRVVPDVYREPGAHGVLGSPSCALEVAALQGYLRYVCVVEGMPHLPQNLRRCGLEIHLGRLADHFRGDLGI